jgi:DNA-directed RNA polymerase subunit RPC12/RpoP
MEDRNFTLITHEEGGKSVERIVSIKVRTRFDKKFDECTHNRVSIDEELWSVQCRDCGEKMDPIKFLVRLAHEEVGEEFRITKLRQEYKRITDILAIKTKTRCQHCKKVTTINTEADIKKIGVLLRYVDSGKNAELNKRIRRFEDMCHGERDDGHRNSNHEYYLLRETEGIKIYVCKYCGQTVNEKRQEGNYAIT